jgi:hypothetical protein
MARGFNPSRQKKNANLLLSRKKYTRPRLLKLFVVCFPGVTAHCGCIFHSPVAGFSLLVFEVS